MCVQRYACDKLLDKKGRTEKCGRICCERRDAFTDEQVEKGNLKAVKLGHISLFSFSSPPLTGGICKKRGVEICASGAGLLILPRKHHSLTMNESVYTIPTLPLTHHLETLEVMRQLNKANRKLAELRGVAQTIPNEALLINTLTLQEAFSALIV